MSHKQRPMKTSRHKSVTVLRYAPKTSFGDSTGRQAYHAASPINLKQYQHARHMSDVMRLAFLENNDISPELWSNIDFNCSTAAILQKNIQQHFEWNNHKLTQLSSDTPSPPPQLSPPQHSSPSPLPPAPRHFHQQPAPIQSRNHSTPHRQRSTPQQTKIKQQKHQQRAPISTLNIASSLNDNSNISNSYNNNNNKNNIINNSNNNNNNHHHLQQHHHQQQQHHNNNNNINGSNNNTPNNNQSRTEFPCDEPGCGKYFPSLRKLRHHKVVHSNDFPYKCQFKGCDKRFKRKFGIDLHSTTHFDLDSHMYSRTSNNSSMQIFGRRMQYSMCKQCDAKFKTVHEYQVHMLAHGKEPFKCLVKGCGQSFSIWKSFQKHRASHYFNYYCLMSPQCEHQTTNLQLLKLHIYCCHFNRKLPDNAKSLSTQQEEPDEPEEPEEPEDE